MILFFLFVIVIVGAVEEVQFYPQQGRGLRLGDKGGEFNLGIGGKKRQFRVQPFNAVPGEDCTFKGDGLIGANCYGYFYASLEGGMIKSFSNKSAYFYSAEEVRQLSFNTSCSQLGDEYETRGEEERRRLHHLEFLVVPLVLVVDKKRAQLFKSQDELKASTIFVATQLKAIYQQMKGDPEIRVQIKRIDYLSETLPWDGSTDSGEILMRFNQWAPPGEISHLLTGKWPGGVVGLAYMHNVCQKGGLGATTTMAIDLLTAKVLAHELGHNLGIYHTNTFMRTSGVPEYRPDCANMKSSVMSPMIYGSQTDWDPCSLQWWTEMVHGNQCEGDTCLRAPGNIDCLLPSEDPGSCGNGIREEGEECDPLGDNCCTSECKVRGCSPLVSKCCTKDCRPKPIGTVCRPTTGWCDPEEQCDGRNPECPQDAWRKDHFPCQQPEGFGACYKGQCRGDAIKCNLVNPAYGYNIRGPCPITFQQCGDLNCAIGFGGLCGRIYAPHLLKVDDGSPCGRKKGWFCFNDVCTEKREFTESPTPWPIMPTLAPTLGTKVPSPPTIASDGTDAPNSGKTKKPHKKRKRHQGKKYKKKHNG